MNLSAACVTDGCAKKIIEVNGVSRWDAQGRLIELQGVALMRHTPKTDLIEYREYEEFSSPAANSRNAMSRQRYCNIVMGTSPIG